MVKNIIPVAGILIACALCAVIPAVPASENPDIRITAPVPAGTSAIPVPAEESIITRQAAEKATDATALPGPWYTPVGEWLGFHAQNATRPATAADTKESTNWWENLFPVKEESSNTVTPLVTQEVPDTAQGQIQTPVTTPSGIPGKNPTGSTAPGNPGVTGKSPGDPGVR